MNLVISDLFELSVHCCVFTVVFSCTLLLCFHVHYCIFMYIVVFSNTLLCFHVQCCVAMYSVVFSCTLLCFHVYCCVFIQIKIMILNLHIIILNIIYWYLQSTHTVPIILIFCIMTCMLGHIIYFFSNPSQKFTLIIFLFRGLV